jgi:hypothetical protein
MTNAPSARLTTMAAATTTAASLGRAIASIARASAIRAAIVVVLALLASGCGSKAPASDPAAAEPTAPAAPGQPADNCTTGDDCELVEACCGCNAGGRRIAIRKDAVASYTSSREQRCGDVMCAQVISQDPSCDAEAICGSRNRCRVAPHMKHQ